MTIIDNEIIDWLDYNVPLGQEPKLKESAPEYVKKKYEAWRKQKNENEAKGIWS